MAAKKQVREEFDPEDLGIEKKDIKPASFPNSEINELKIYFDSRFIKKEEVEELRQLIHNKGLSVGLPSMIVHDINEIAMSLNILREVIVSDKLKEQWQIEHEEARKMMMSGKEVLGFDKLEKHSMRMENLALSLSPLLLDMINKLNRLQKRMIGKDIYDLER